MTTRRATDRRTTLEKHQEEVIALLLTGTKPVQVAEKYKVARSSVTKFIKRHDDKLTALHAEVERQTSDFAIASVVNRIAALDDRWRRQQSLIQARANDPRYRDEPGYETGLLVHSLKSIGGGDNAEVVDEFKTDTALMAEMRATERAAAEELGQIGLKGSGDAGVTNYNFIQLIGGLE